MDNNFNGGNNFNDGNNGGYNYTPQPELQKGSNGLAIASLVLGILSVISCCCWWLSVILGVVGIVLAILSKSKSATGKLETMAIIGMVLSIIGIVIAVVYVVWAAAFIKTSEYQEIYNQMINSSSN